MITTAGHLLLNDQTLDGLNTVFSSGSNFEIAIGDGIPMGEALGNEVARETVSLTENYSTSYDLENKRAYVCRRYATFDFAGSQDITEIALVYNGTVVAIKTLTGDLVDGSAFRKRIGKDLQIEFPLTRITRKDPELLSDTDAVKVWAGPQIQNNIAVFADDYALISSGFYTRYEGDTPKACQFKATKTKEEIETGNRITYEFLLFPSDSVSYPFPANQIKSLRVGTDDITKYGTFLFDLKKPLTRNTDRTFRLVAVYDETLVEYQ